jgi:alanyl-tRNA synthetase
LRQVLGAHVNQKGSYVNDKMLRFDFSHFSKLTDEEIERIEKIVNQKIRQDIPLDEKRSMPIAEAKKLGATALFGEKYGENVRVITFDKDFSMELCGGTHVKATGQIGYFKITAESSVAAGVRRIEAITADETENFVNRNIKELLGLKEALKAPKEPLKALNELIEEKSRLLKQIEGFYVRQGQDVKAQLLNKIETADGINYIIDKVEIASADALKQVAFELKAKVENLFMVLAANVDDKPQITVMISDNLVADKKLNANNIVRDLAKEIQGGGGGQPFYATAGGKNIRGLDKVVEKARMMVKESV